MEITNAAVIYFAFGVPFGVLSAYLRTSRLEPFDVFLVTYHLAFWPLIVLVRAFSELTITQRQVKQFKSGKGSHQKTVDRKLRSQMAIRDGLEDAHKAALSATELRLPFEDAIRHPNPALAAKCFHRRNLKRLEKHALEAQSDYSKILAESSSGDRQPRVLRSGTQDVYQDFAGEAKS